MQDFAAGSLISNLARADLVIADRGRFAIGFYFREGMPAPLCLCKGSKKKASIMLEFAHKQGIPIIERPILAKKLFYAVENNDYISSEFYHELAEIMAQRINPQ
jgi:flagellar biosynthetic protein FlhB